MAIASPYREKETSMFSSYEQNHFFCDMGIEGAFPTYHGDPRFYTDVMYPLWLLNDKMREVRIIKIAEGQRYAKRILYNYFDFMNKIQHAGLRFSWLDHWMGDVSGGQYCLTFPDTVNIATAQPHMVDPFAVVSQSEDKSSVAIRIYSVALDPDHCEDYVMNRYLCGAVVLDSLLGYTPEAAVEVIIRHEPLNKRYVVSAAY